MTGRTLPDKVWSMKKLCAIPVVLALALVVVAPVSASTPKQTIKAQRATITNLKQQVINLKAQRDAARSDLKVANKSLLALPVAQADLATRTVERDTANASLATANANLSAQTILTAQAAAGYVAGLSPDQLWGVLVAVYPLLPNSSGLCGYSRTAFFGSSLTSYSFDRWAC